MFGRISQRFLRTAQKPEVSNRIAGPFVVDAQNESVLRVIKQSKIDSNPNNGHVEAYAPSIGERFNSDVKDTIGLLTGSTTENTSKSKIVFYTNEAPSVVHNQCTGDVVAFSRQVPITIALISSNGKVEIHNEKLVEDIEEKLLSSLSTLTDKEAKALYEQVLNETLSDIRGENATLKYSK